MKDVNSVTLIGNLTKDATLHTFEGGDTGVISFSIAVNTTGKKDGKYIDTPNFFSVKFYGKKLEKLLGMLSKGQKVALQGHLTQERWEKDGKTSSSTVIVAEHLQLVGGRKSESSEAPADEYPSEQSYSGEIQEDIPF